MIITYKFTSYNLSVIEILIYIMYFHLINFNQCIDLDIKSFVCEYLGLLEPLRHHLIVDLSRKKHIKVLTLFVTIEIGVFHLSAIISANLL